MLVCVLILVMGLPCLAQTHATKPVAKPATKPTVAPAKPPPAPPPVIQATVNGSPVSETHVNQAIAGHWAVPIMRQIIEDRLVRQEARHQGLKMSPEAVQALFKAERDKFASDEAFQHHLHAQGYTTESYTEKLTTDALVKDLIDRLTEITPAAVKAYYTDHQGDFIRPAQAHVHLIMTETIEEAYLVRERLAAGDKFDVVAREVSKHPSANKGGDLGWITAAELPDRTIAQAIFGMEPGVVSSPLRAGDKFYIALVQERKPAQTVSLEQATPEITAKLMESRSVSRQDYMDYLARRADIAVTWAPAKYLAQEYAALRVIGVVVDGKPLALPQAPVKLPNGTVGVPAKPVLQAAGAGLAWQASTSTLIAANAFGTVKLTVGSPRALVGTQKPQARDMKQPPVMRDAVLFIAPRIVLEALGASVEWDGIRNRLVITTSGGNMPSPTASSQPGGLERQ